MPSGEECVPFQDTDGVFAPSKDVLNLRELMNEDAAGDCPSVEHMASKPPLVLE